jgi:hypothetical protein
MVKLKEEIIRIDKSHNNTSKNLSKLSDLFQREIDTVCDLDDDMENLRGEVKKCNFERVHGIWKLEDEIKKLRDEVRSIQRPSNLLESLLSN